MNLRILLVVVVAWSWVGCARPVSPPPLAGDDPANPGAAGSPVPRASRTLAVEGPGADGGGRP